MSVSVRDLAAKFSNGSATPQTPDQFERTQRQQRQAEKGAKQIARERAARYNMSLRAQTLRRASKSTSKSNEKSRPPATEKQVSQKAGKKVPLDTKVQFNNSEPKSSIGKFLRSIRWSMKPPTRQRALAPEAVLHQEAKRLNSRPKRRATTLESIEEENEENPVSPSKPSSRRSSTATSRQNGKANRRGTAMQAIASSTSESEKSDTDEFNRVILSTYLTEAVRQAPSRDTNILDNPEAFEDEVDRLLNEVRGREGSFFEALADEPFEFNSFPPEPSDPVPRNRMGSFDVFVDQFDFDALQPQRSEMDDINEREISQTPLDSKSKESAEDTEHWRNVLNSFYRVYNPTRIDRVEPMLKAFVQRRDQMLTKLEHDYQVTFSEDGFAHVERVGENVDRLKGQLIRFYKKKRPNALYSDSELELRIDRMMSKYSFKDLAGVVRRIFGELPPGWEMELSNALEL